MPFENKPNGCATSPKKIELKKQITLFQCVCIIVGIIIGSGIFVSPVGILYNVRSVGMSCVMWAVCGLYSAICALCFAELGACIPQSGGEYVYIKRTFGDVPAFLCCWVNLVIVCPVSVAASCLVFATYILKPLFPECDPPHDAVRLLAALIILLLISLNCINVTWATKVQVVITGCKLIALIIIVITGFVWIARGNVENFKNSFEGSDYSASSVAIAFYSGFWAYGGWSYLNFLTDEVVNPHKNLPRAIIISMIIVTAIYIATNVAYFAVLTPSEVLKSSAVAVTFSQQTVTALQYLMPILIAASVIGGINGFCLSMSRLFYVGAKNKHLPYVVSMITKNQLTPAPSLIGIMVLVLAMQNFENIFYLIEMMGFSFAVILATVLAGQVYLRWKEPDLYRPIKLPILIPISMFLVSCALLALTVYQKPNESLMTIGLMCLGLPVYVVGVSWKKPAQVRNVLNSFTVIIQKLLLVVEPDDSN